MIDKKKIIEIFKASPTPTLVLRANAPHYHIIQANNAYTQIKGISPDQLIGKTVFEVESELTETEGEINLRDSLEKVVSTKESHRMATLKHEILFKTPDNIEKRYWSPENTPVLNEKNEVEFILHTIYDVTHQVLREVDNKLMFNNTTESFILVDTCLNIINFNAQFEKNYFDVFNKKVLKGDSILDYAQPERREIVKGIYDKVFGGEQIDSIIKAPFDGKERIFKIRYKPAIDADEIIFGAFVSLIEVTKEYNAKEDLKVSEARYRALVENGGDVVIILSPEGKQTYVSPSIKNVLGYSYKEALKLDLFSIVHPDDVPHVRNELALCLEKPGIPFTVTPARMQHKDGSWRWFDGTITNMLHDPAINGIVDNFKDITLKVEAEEARKLERRTKEALINSTDDLIWSVDNDLKLIAANKATTDFLNSDLKPGDYILSGFENSPHEKKWKYFYQRALTGESFRIETKEPVTKSESPDWFETSFNPIYEGDEVTGVACFSRNTTENKLTRQKLKKTEQKLRNIVEHSTNLFYQHTTDHKLTFISRQCREFLGYEPEEAMKKWVEFATDNPINHKGFEITQRAIETGKVQPPYELELQKRNGELIWVEVHEAPLIEDGKTVAIVGSLTNITDRKIYEEKLKESLERYNYVTKATKDAIYDFNIIEDHLHWGKGFTTLFGYETNEEKYPIKKWAQLVHPDDKERTHQALQSTLQDENTNHWEFEYRFLKSDGDYAYVIESGFIVRDENKKAVRMIGALQDITAKKVVEQELVFSEQRFKAMVQDGSDLIAILDKDFIFTYVSPSLGQDTQSLIGKNSIDFIHPEDQARVRKAKKGLSIQKRIFIKPYRMKDMEGKWHWIETIITNLLDEPAVQGYVANSKNVTRQIKRENKLQELSLVASKTTDLVVITDSAGKITWLNKAFEELTGYTLEEVINKKPGEFLQGPDTNNETRERISAAVKKAEPIEEVILNYDKSGTTYWLELNIDPIFDEDGICTNFIAIERDVTKEVKEEERLKLLESVITNTSEFVIIMEAENTDLPGRKIIYVNEAFIKQTGYSKEEVVGKTAHFLNGPKTDKQVLVKLQDSMEKFKASNVEFINYKKNGEEFWINTSMVPVADKSGNYTHWVAIGRDISDQKLKEREIQNSLREKETLLAEIHHRVKNNLAVVSGMMQLQAFETENEDLQVKLFDSVGRIKTMGTVHELLYKSNSFSKLEFSDTLNELLNNITETLQTNVKVDVDLKCDPVHLNITQAIPTSLIVNEVVTNIYKHAFVDTSKGKINFKLSQKDLNLHLEISDNGKGLPDNIESIKHNSLGFQLIEVLSQQLDADFTYEGSPAGTTFTLNFVNNETENFISEDF